MYCKWNVTFYSSWPSSECPSCPSFSSSDASTWRWPRPKMLPGVGLCVKIPELPDRCGRNDSWPQRFDVDLKKSVPACRSVELFRLQRLSYVSQKIETVYGLESLIGCFHCKCYFGESLAAGNLSSAFVQHDTVPGEECIFTRGHRSSRA